MVPTARAYAGLCQEIPAASPVTELWTCLHVWRTKEDSKTRKIYVSIQRETAWTVFNFLGLSRTTEARCGGNMPKALS